MKTIQTHFPEGFTRIPKPELLFLCLFERFWNNLVNLKVSLGSHFFEEIGSGPSLGSVEKESMAQILFKENVFRKFLTAGSSLVHESLERDPAVRKLPVSL